MDVTTRRELEIKDLKEELAGKDKTLLCAERFAKDGLGKDSTKAIDCKCCDEAVKRD